ncbi:MAG: hypothetical protein RIR51_1802, partial [Bacteroidota bacterium]
MKKIKSKYLLLIFPFLIILGFSLPNNKILELAKSIEIYASVLKELDKFYAEEIQPKELVENSIESMLEGLDPYTSYYPEEEIDNYLALTTGKYEGIGIVLNIVDKKFYVFDVEEGSPAEKANLHIGDQIIKVNNEEISGLSQSEVNRLIAGKSGTKIELTVQSIENQEIRAFDISRSTIHLKNIHYYQLLDEETGIIDLNEFNHEASNEFKNAFLDLKKQGMKKLIIDLSSNPGGLLTQAVEICNYFIPKNKKVVVTKGKREEWNNTYFTINNPLDETIPIIIIIDPNTASASEILAGVLQEYDRALILGQKSYGKGLVQITRDLPYRTKIKLTTARYYLPSGRCIQKINYFNSEITDTTLNYQTQNGRPLTNTGGISPDFQTVAKNFLPFFQFLVEKDLIFKYTLQNFKNEKD